VPDLDDALVQLGLQLVAEVRARGHHLLDVALQLARARVDELELLLDTERELWHAGSCRSCDSSRANHVFGSSRRRRVAIQSMRAMTEMGIGSRQLFRRVCSSPVARARQAFFGWSRPLPSSSTRDL
jgi:hypothetical protein